MTDTNGFVAGSRLEKVLRAGHFAVTGELGPPTSANAQVIAEKAQHLKDNVDSVNITDCQTSVVRMSSIAVGVQLLQLGIEPNIQMTCRDRNRIAIQSDLLGASALGLKNLLCLTGDHQSFGNHAMAKNVFDMDSIGMLMMVKAMRDEGVVQSGDKMDVPPRFFLGAAANPFADPFDFRPYRLAKKVRAGADFVQTQLIYNVPKFAEYMKRAGDLGLLDDVYVLAGVGPIRSLRAAQYMATKVPGMDVPDEIVDRLSGAVEGIKSRRERRAAWEKEGIQLCVEIIQQVREIPGVAGVHLMAIEWEDAVPTIVDRAALLPRPTV